MNKYINTFANSGDYETYKASSELSTPNVAYLEDTKEVKYLNSMADLYNIYGTVKDGTTSLNFAINSINQDANISDGKFTYKWSGGTVSRIQFYYKPQLITVDGFYFNLSDGCTLNSFFNFCSNLVSADLSGMRTIGVYDINSLFARCTSLVSIDLSNWDTSAVTSVGNVFQYNNALTTVTMNNTNTTTFDMIKAQLVSNSVASHVTIIRDGVNWKYQNGAWVEA